MLSPTTRTYAMAGLHKADSSLRDTDNLGVNISMNGPLFAIAEIGCRCNGLPGDSRLLRGGVHGLTVKHYRGRRPVRDAAQVCSRIYNVRPFRHGDGLSRWRIFRGAFFP
jgi:hypothetical protein